MEAMTSMLLDEAKTMTQKVDAVEHGLGRGVPLIEMEQRLDWLELVTKFLAQGGEL